MPFKRKSYGKKRFSKKSSRMGGRKFHRGPTGKSVKVRIAKVEKVLRQRKPELKHKFIFPSTLVAATLDVTAYPAPGAGLGAYVGPAEGLWKIPKGTGENQLVGGAMSYANGTIVFRIRPPDPNAGWYPSLPGYQKRSIRAMVIQFRSRENIYAGNVILPYSDIEASYIRSTVDFEKKETKGFKILFDKVIQTTSEELGGVGVSWSNYSYHPKTEILKLSIKPHWPLVYDDDAGSPTEPMNPLFVYFFEDSVGLNNGANHQVVFLQCQHVWRDNS